MFKKNILSKIYEKRKMNENLLRTIYSYCIINDKYEYLELYDYYINFNRNKKWNYFGEPYSIIEYEILIKLRTVTAILMFQKNNYYETIKEKIENETKQFKWNQHKKYCYNYINFDDIKLWINRYKKIRSNGKTYKINQNFWNEVIDNVKLIDIDYTDYE